MREMWALVRASWHSARSYRTGIVLSVFSMIVTTTVVYFVAHALPESMHPTVAGRDTSPFAFLIIGMVAFMFVTTTVNSIPDAISSGISSGTLEALLSTRASLSSILTGLVGYGYLWTAVKALLYLVFALALGMRVEWHAALTSVVLLALIVLAYVPFGLLASSMFIAFRTNASIPAAVMIVSGLLGGVYIPMNSSRIPDFARRLSEFVPLTPGLRALRETLLQGTPLADVMPDILMLLGFVLFLNALSLWVFTEALRYARRSGTLAQY